jgi:hypothetical protein
VSVGEVGDSPSLQPLSGSVRPTIVQATRAAAHRAVIGGGSSKESASGDWAQIRRFEARGVSHAGHVVSTAGVAPRHATMSR